MNKILTRGNPKLLLILSRALAAARPAILSFLITQGDRLGGDKKIPVSFCNVLFVGNLCSAIAVCFFLILGQLFTIWLFAVR